MPARPGISRTDNNRTDREHSIVDIDSFGVKPTASILNVLGLLRSSVEYPMATRCTAKARPVRRSSRR